MKTFLTTTLLLLLTLPVFAADPIAKTEITHVDPKAAAALIDEKKVTILDVRTDAEYKDGHLANAINHDFTEDDFKTQIDTLDKEKPYLIHCQSGARSAKSLKAFKALGFKHIYHLDGGISAWKDASLPVTK
ncbi:rhodanese-like domain-containing protein [Phragmitibacter flavus]|nr:rhodanese-like domain-containing protein [Phragmitibacter flavus]